MAVTSLFLDRIRVTGVVKRLTSWQWWRFRYWIFDSFVVKGIQPNGGDQPHFVIDLVADLSL